MEDNLLAPWELRLGNFRVFYDLDEGKKKVIIVAVGNKIHNKLRIGGEEIEL
jgi:mRNA-degrading endonuclease RelE of RelBE toxin-antitoxin system